MESTVQQLEQQLNQAQFGSQQFTQLSQNLQQARRALAQVQQQTQATSAGANQAGQNAQQMGSQFQDAFNIASLAAGNTGQALQSLQGGFQSVQGGIGTVVKGFSTLKGAIASTGIGLLLLAFGALVTYFTRSQEAMNFLDRKTKALQAVFNLLSQQVAKVGKFLFEAFQNPKKTLTELVDAIQTNLMNRLKSFAVVLEGIRDMDFEKVTNGVIQFGTGIENASQKARNLSANLQQFGKDAAAAAKEAERLALSNQQISAQERALNVERANSRARIEALKKASEDVTKSFTARIEASKQAAAIEDALIQKQLRLTDQKIQNLQAEHKLKGDITSADKDALAELQVQRAEVLQESLGLQTELQNTLNGLRQEQKDKDKTAADERKAAADKAVEENKARLEKEAADASAATALKFANQKAALERELALAEEGSTEQLRLRKQLAELETETQLASITEKYEKAGPKEKDALVQQVKEVQAAGNAAQQKIEADFQRERTLKAAQNEADLAQVKVLGLREGTKEYFQALLEQVNAEERLALAQLKDTKENEAQRTKIVAEAAKQRREIVTQIATAPTADLGDSILKKLFGVSDDDLDEVKAKVNEAADAAMNTTLELLTMAGQARMEALQAQMEEADSILGAAKDAADALDAQLEDSQSRIDSLEDQLLNAKGAQRERIIKQLEVERQRNAAIAADKQKEDARAKQAEKEKIALQQQQQKEQEKMNRLALAAASIDKAVTAGLAIQAAVKATVGANSIPFPGNLAAIVVALAATASAIASAKQLANGFDEGGFTGSGFGTPDDSGFRVAGVVHENEWVAPKWMVTSPKFSSTIAQLEVARQNGGTGYAQGGYAQVAVPTPQQGVDMTVLVAMQQNIQTLQQQTAAALQKPITVRPSDIVTYEADRTRISDHYLN
ncbi:hypothetical protein [Solirubrum puertoriconensis]|uniref:hypothetical protein n=1 Tax=Solirubrum puertoriconensis TaxID=1751427 RepID=UPI00122E6131|nr:hypothetical protein [Solirubrum puertoriconensis]